MFSLLHPVFVKSEEGRWVMMRSMESLSELQCLFQSLWRTGTSVLWGGLWFVWPRQWHQSRRACKKARGRQKEIPLLWCSIAMQKKKKKKYKSIKCSKMYSPWMFFHYESIICLSFNTAVYTTFVTCICERQEIRMSLKVIQCLVPNLGTPSRSVNLAHKHNGGPESKSQARWKHFPSADLSSFQACCVVERDQNKAFVIWSSCSIKQPLPTKQQTMRRKGTKIVKERAITQWHCNYRKRHWRLIFCQLSTLDTPFCLQVAN